MTQTRPLGTFFCVALLALLALPVFAACSSSEAPDPNSSAGIEREGDTNEAQLSTFLHEKPRVWGWAGGAFDAPEDNATLAADTPLTFTWHADPSDITEDDAPGQVVVTHLLRFSSERRGSFLNVFTSLSEYTPNAEAWRRLVEAGEPITVSIMTGTFAGTALPTAGGPFIGETLTFTIE